MDDGRWTMEGISNTEQGITNDEVEIAAVALLLRDDRPDGRRAFSACGAKYRTTHGYVKAANAAFSMG